MPIECIENLNRINQAEFHKIDWEVTRCAFDTQNSIGNLFREEAYHREFMRQLSRKGFRVSSEVKFHVYHDKFQRDYPCDLLVENSVIYECKAVRKISPAHKNQLLHYLFLADLAHGKIFNFSSPSVSSEFVSTTYNRKDRQSVGLAKDLWIEPDIQDSVLDIFSSLILDWGTGLYLQLYLDALVFFLGPKNISHQELTLEVEGEKICKQPAWIFRDGSLLHLSSFPQQTESQRLQLKKFQKALNLPSIHWINLSSKKVFCVTIN